MKKQIISARQCIFLFIIGALFLFIIGGCEKDEVFSEINLITSGKIVFSQFHDSKYDIFILDHTGEKTIIEAGNSKFVSPTWSPDGSRIAFTDGTFLSGAIYWMNEDGSSKTLVNDGNHTRPSWSPDGKSLCFAENNGSDIYTIQLDGTGLTKVVDANGGAPDWSPDGTQIVFWNVPGDNFEIFSVNTNGSGLTNLTNSTAAEESPKWSPDGTLIAYSKSEDGSSPYNIYIMEADGANVTQLTQVGMDQAALQPCWSPDGNQILFTMGNGLFVIDIDGSNMKKVYQDGLGVSSPDWH